MECRNFQVFKVYFQEKERQRLADLEEEQRRQEEWEEEERRRQEQLAREVEEELRVCCSILGFQLRFHRRGLEFCRMHTSQPLKIQILCIYDCQTLNQYQTSLLSEKVVGQLS